MSQLENVSIGDILVGYNSALWYNKSFYKVTSFTKSGNPRVVPLKRITNSIINTPAHWSDTVTPDLNSDSTGQIALRKTKDGLKVDKYIYISSIYDPETVYINNKYG